MSYEAAIGYAEDGLTVAALVGAIWSAVAFIRKLNRERDDERRRSVARWLRVEIHRIIFESEKMLTVEQIVNQLRSASFLTDIDIKKEEISEAEVRLLLLDLIQSGVIGQRWPNLFGFTHLPFDPSIGVVSDNVKGNLASRKAYSAIMTHPGEYTSVLLWNQFGEESGLSHSDFYLAINDLIQKKVVRVGPDKKWYPVELGIEGNT